MLQPVKGRLDTQQYLNFLQVLRELSDEPRQRLVHDHYPVHKARAVATWLASNPHFDVLAWPRKSADLMAISDLFEEILFYVNDLQCNVNSVEMLEQLVRSAWEAVATPNYVKGLIENIPSRCRAVIEAHGGQPRY